MFRDKVVASLHETAIRLYSPCKFLIWTKNSDYQPYQRLSVFSGEIGDYS